MPQGDKSKYTSKQHCEQSFEVRGTPKKEAAKTAAGTHAARST